MISKPLPPNGNYKTLYRAKAKGPNKYTQTQMNYDDYLHTDVWEDIQGMRFAIDGYKCQKCGSAINIQIHHKTYPDVWGTEDIRLDIITVCEECHKKIHDKES